MTCLLPFTEGGGSLCEVHLSSFLEAAGGFRPTEGAAESGLSCVNLSDDKHYLGTFPKISQISMTHEEDSRHYVATFYLMICKMTSLNTIDWFIIVN